jgi:hypothetical protein
MSSLIQIKNFSKNNLYFQSKDEKEFTLIPSETVCEINYLKNSDCLCEYFFKWRGRKITINNLRSDTKGTCYFEIQVKK